METTSLQFACRVTPNTNVGGICSHGLDLFVHNNVREEELSADQYV